MLNNDVLRSIRYTLDASDGRIVQILADGGHTATIDEVRAYLRPEDSEGAVKMDDATMARFLDGLVISLRGKDDKHPAPPLEPRVTNNVVLKKLRVAFNLKEADLFAVFAAAECKISKPELSAFFRKADNPHYRPCNDQYLRYFLKGLTSFQAR
jgi:uncharacterized protein YehS (DUF1456 family)